VWSRNSTQLVSVALHCDSVRPRAPRGSRCAASVGISGRSARGARTPYPAPSLGAAHRTEGIGAGWRRRHARPRGLRHARDGVRDCGATPRATRVSAVVPRASSADPGRAAVADVLRTADGVRDHRPRDRPRSSRCCTRRADGRRLYGARTAAMPALGTRGDDDQLREVPSPPRAPSVEHVQVTFTDARARGFRPRPHHELCRRRPRRSSRSTGRGARVHASSFSASCGRGHDGRALRGASWARGDEAPLARARAPGHAVAWRPDAGPLGDLTRHAPPHAALGPELGSTRRGACAWSTSTSATLA
jgi:hypothetical protein